MRCRRAIICLPPVMLVSLAPVLVIYHKTSNAPSLPCFFEFPGDLMAKSQSTINSQVINIITIVMTYIYLVELGLYVCIPMAILPICSMLLPRRIHHIMSNSRRLKHPVEFYEPKTPNHQLSPRGHRKSQRTEVRVARELILISIFTTVCLSPNIWWIPYGLSMQECFHIHMSLRT